MSKFWKTGITRVRPNQILIRGYPVESLARKRSFGDIVFLLLTGELPRRREGELVEAILVCCCDPGLLAPGTDASVLSRPAACRSKPPSRRACARSATIMAGRSNPWPG